MKRAVFLCLAMLAGLACGWAYPDAAARNESGNTPVPLAIEALQRAGVADVYPLGRESDLTSTDLNANLYAPGVVSEKHADGPLIRRTIPGLLYWINLPENGYALYDWIRGFSTCPPRPASNPHNDLCYGANGWLDAGFHSLHYGSQAAAMYRRLHAIAVDQARFARDFRESLSSQARPGWLDDVAYQDWLREAELLALAYESMAQHFLQDRLNPAHAWERWNAPGYTGNPYRDDPAKARYVAFVSRLIHDGVAHERDRADMLSCAMSSYVEVIKTFGANNKGGYGAHDARLSEEAAQMDVINGACMNSWLDNATLANAWLGDPETRLSQTARIILPGRAGYGFKPAQSRLMLTRLAARMAWRSWADPAGTDLARGGLGALGEAKPGSAYELPAYVPSARLNDLPDIDPQGRGRDKRTIFGFFNKGRTDYLCRTMRETLAGLRGAENSTRENAVCRFIADRAYTGTPAGYRGPQREYRTLGWRTNPFSRIHSACQIVPGDARLSFSEAKEHTPLYLQPGYVHAGAGGKIGRYGLSTQSIANWCDKVPVLDLIPNQADPELYNSDVAAVIADEHQPVDLHGRHLGEEPGVIILSHDGSSAAEISGNDILRWRDDWITFRLPPAVALTEDGFHLSVRRADGISTPGRFVLKEGIAPPRIERLVLSRGDTVFYDFDARLGEATIVSPISPGPLTLNVTFGDAMEKRPPPSKNGRRETFQIAGRTLDGRWRNDHEWHGTAEFTADEFGTVNGWQPITIIARSAAGGWTTQSEERRHRVLLDIYPLYVERLFITAGRDTIYDAAWIGGPDRRDLSNVRAKGLRNSRRLLQVATAQRITQSAALNVSLTLSAPPATPPVLSLGGASVKLVRSKEPFIWTGIVDTNSLSDQDSGLDAVVPVTIALEDLAGKGLDGDPGTVAYASDPEQHAGIAWLNYEDERGGRIAPDGGIDNWHRLGQRPSMSLVVLLDASSSMARAGRMQTARDGIRETLRQLDETAEVATVVFFDCNDIRISPFTSDKSAIADYLSSITPTGRSAFTQALRVTGELLRNGAHPGSGQWSYIAFSDGLETCGGNPVEAGLSLETLIKRHQAALNGESGGAGNSRLKAGDTLAWESTCRPREWRRFRIEGTGATDPGTGFFLTEYHYREQYSPGDGCRARLTQMRHQVLSEHDTQSWIAAETASDAPEIISETADEQALTALRQQAARLWDDTVPAEQLPAQINDRRQAAESVRQ